MKDSTSANAQSGGKWLPDMDLNHDKQIQSLLCYRYTIGQKSGIKVDRPPAESSIEDSANLIRRCLVIGTH